MTAAVLRVALGGVTGRMGYRQHLVRSVLAIREEGGVTLTDGSRVQLAPVLVGRDENKLRELSSRHHLEDWTTDLDEALRGTDIYFDAQVTSAREKAVLAAIAAGCHVYAEKPVASTFAGAVELARAAAQAGVCNGVVHDKLFLPGLLKLRGLIDEGFFGRILSVRGEFGYWVFPGDTQPAQRPSWNYRSADGGGIVMDMFCHWNYLMENLFGAVRAVTARAVTHIGQRWDEDGRAYAATADDAAYAIFELDGGAIAQINSSWCVRVHRDELVEFQVDGVHGSAVAGLHHCATQPGPGTPLAAWNPDVPTTQRFRDGWREVASDGPSVNGFKAQWERFVRDVAEGTGHEYDFASGARGLRLAEAGLRSSAEGRRIELD